MTTIEFFAAKYNEPETARIMRRDINEEIATDSEKYVKLAVDYFIGCAWSFNIEPAVEDLEEMVASKMVRIREYSSYRNRMRGQTKEYVLTAKGAKKLYQHIKAA